MRMGVVCLIFVFMNQQVLMEINALYLLNKNARLRKIKAKNAFLRRLSRQVVSLNLLPVDDEFVLRRITEAVWHGT